MVQCELSMYEGLMLGHSLSLTHTPYCVTLNGWELAVMTRTAFNLQALALCLADFSLGCSTCMDASILHVYLVPGGQKRSLNFLELN